jgi:hypothetical protein
LCRFRQNESVGFFDWLPAVSFERLALHTLRRFAAVESLTEKQLQGVASQLQLTCHVAPSLVAAAKNQHLFYRQLMNHEGYLWNHRDSLRISEYFRNALDTQSWADGERVVRMTALIAAEADGTLSAWTKEYIDRNCIFQNNSFVMDFVDLSPLEVVSPDPSGGYAYRVLQALEPDDLSTAVVIALQQYRRKHGHFPERLELLKDIGIDRHHAWLEKLMQRNEIGYAPDGYGESLPFQADSGSIELLDPSQPLLWTNGDMQPSELRRAILSHSLPHIHSLTVKFTLCGEWAGLVQCTVRIPSCVHSMILVHGRNSPMTEGVGKRAESTNQISAGFRWRQTQQAYFFVFRRVLPVAVPGPPMC